MADAHVKQVLNLLQAMARDGLPAAKRLFWSELNYERVDDALPIRAWPDTTQEMVAEAPVLLAQHETDTGSFDVIHVVLDPAHRGRNFPLSIIAERRVVEELLKDHPYALYLFSDIEMRHWHFVNVKYRRDGGDEGAARAVIRRITVGPEERLRTAAERIAMLDLEHLSPDLTGLSPLAIQQQHDVAFDVERVTQDFFTTYRRIFEQAEVLIEGLDDEEELRLFTQRLFNRLLFIVFLERKGWLTFDRRTDYLNALWESYRSGEIEAEENFYQNRLKLLFFSGLNNATNRDIVGIHRKGPIPQRVGQVPYLNGGLFEEETLDQREDVVVPDEIFNVALDDLLYHYNFTVTESTPLDVEVAVDPEMLGRIFEELVTGRHETGSYYTPKPVVAFMCREALKGYLEDMCPREEAGAVAAFVDEREVAAMRDPERVLTALQTVRTCDPACGSGAYLLGMLHELVELRQALFRIRGLDPRAVYEKKLDIIQNNLYGVDIDPFAVNIARLRLWLSLIVDFEGDVPPPLPNLAYKIEVGDSLTAPAPTQLQPDLFHHQLVKDYFALKSRFMTAHGPEKRDLRVDIEAAKAEIADWLGTSSDPDAFDWTVEFAEVFTGPGWETATMTGRMTGVVNAAGGQMHLAAQEGRDPGFDIVVANPPYVRQELLSQAQKARYKTVYPEVYSGTADLYVYFYVRTLHLLRSGGMASIISSNKWLRARYGKKLRKYFLGQTTVETIIDFGDLPLFKATTYPMIIVFSRTQSEETYEIQVIEVEDLSIVDRLGEEVRSQAWAQSQRSLREEVWTLQHPSALRLLDKLRNRYTKLQEYIDDEFYIGIKTGRNRVFVIDSATYERLVDKDPRSVEVVRPWLRGRNVKRWQIEAGDEYVIAFRSSTNQNRWSPWSEAETEVEAEAIFEESYPALYDYMKRHEESLKTRSDQGRFWWELRPCTYYHIFDDPKIVWPDIAQHCEFTIDRSGAYPDMTLFVTPTESMYLLGILNSRVTEWFIMNTSSQIQQGFLRFKRTYMRPLPIAEPTKSQRAAIEEIVNNLLDVKVQDPKIEDCEQELNALVYDIYELTREEIALIEESVQR